MAWLNANGSPVAMQPITIQIDVPSETAVMVGAPNWGAVLAAAIQLIFAMMTGNPAAIALAIQALLKAVMGG